MKELLKIIILSLLVVSCVTKKETKKIDNCIITSKYEEKDSVLNYFFFDPFIISDICNDTVINGVIPLYFEKKDLKYKLINKKNTISIQYEIDNKKIAFLIYERVSDSISNIATVLHNEKLYVFDVLRNDTSNIENQLKEIDIYDNYKIFCCTRTRHSQYKIKKIKRFNLEYIKELRGTRVEGSQSINIRKETKTENKQE